MQKCSNVLRHFSFYDLQQKKQTKNLTNLTQPLILASKTYLTAF